MFDAIERGLYWFSSFGLNSDVDAICQIDHNLDEHTFVTTTGSLLTMFRIVGSRRLVGPEEFDGQSAALARELSIQLKSGNKSAQHSVLFGFRSDKSGGRARVTELMEPSRNTAKRFGADADWLFNDRLDAMSGHVVDEVAVFGFLTHSTGMNPAEKERASVDRAGQRAKMAKSNVNLSEHTQMRVLGPGSLMISRHMAALSTIERAISDPGGQVRIMVNKMTVHESGRIMRRFLDAGPVPEKWRPQMIGDRPGGVSIPRAGETALMGMPKRFSRQVVTERLTNLFTDAEIVKRGRHHYATLVMEIPPQDEIVPAFSKLADSIGGEIPYQVHFDISNNGLNASVFEKFFAGIFGAVGAHNKSIKMAWDELKNIHKTDYVCGMKVIFCTWAEDQRKCVDNLAFLRAKVDAWGQPGVTNETASPAAAFLSSAPGFSGQIPADMLPTPISVACRMLPVFRPSSVWNSGQLLFHTAEGRPYPVALGSTIQNFWGTLVFAPTGYGKSFLMNMLNSGALFSPGLTELPMITIIDKGPSAKGMLDLAKAMLPPHLASQCVYLRPTNGDASFVVNPFDTQLGCDFPMAADIDFCAALLGTMAPNLGPEGGKFINKVISTLYDYYSRSSVSAKRWQSNLDRGLTAKLAQVGIDYDESKPPRVWSVVDAFFKAGMIDEAGQAQIFAVPTLLDITTVVNSDPRVKSEYGNAKLANDETIISVFLRNITGAQSQYKMFSGISRFKGQERVMVIDTEGLASSSTSDEGKRLYGISLLFARRLGARNFFLHPDDIAGVSPELYMQYHLLRAQKIKEQMKFLEYDEIHNAKGIQAVQDLLQKDAREGRKYNIVTVLSSQSVDDFPKDLVENSYNFFILGAGDGSAQEIQKKFNLTDSEVLALTRDCTGPGKLFAMFRTSLGMLSQVLYSRPGPIESWAYSTSANDTAVRDALYKRFGTRKTLEFLAKEYPSGSARLTIEKMRLQMGSESSSDGITAELLKSLAIKMID